MISIRPARSDEVKVLQDLNDEAFAANPDFDADLVVGWAQSESGRRYFANLVQDDRQCCFVAEDGGRLVGYIAASPKVFDHRRSRYLEIDNLGVAPSYRRQGLGAQFMDECSAWAKSRGDEKVHLWCYANNTEALEYYENRDFTRIEIGLEKEI